MFLKNWLTTMKDAAIGGIDCYEDCSLQQWSEQIMK